MYRMEVRMLLFSALYLVVDFELLVEKEAFIISVLLPYLCSLHLLEV